MSRLHGDRKGEEPDWRGVVKRDFERWDWEDTRSQGFLHFVLVRRMLDMGVPTALLFFVVIAWLENIPVLDIISGRTPGFGYLVKKFLLILGLFLVSSAAFAVHEWRSRERRNKKRER